VSQWGFKRNPDSPFRREWGRWVLSWKIWAVMALTRIISSAVLFQSEFRESFGRVLLSVTLGYLAAGLVMAAAGLTVLRNRFSQPPRLSVVAGVWITAGLALYAVTEASLGLTDSDQFNYLSALRFTIAFAIKLAAALMVVSYLLVSRAEVAKLRQSNLRHQQAVSNASGYLNDLRRRNLQALDVSLRPNLDLLLAEAQMVANNTVEFEEFADLPARIQSFGRNEVRVLSHRIAAGDADTDRWQGAPDPTTEQAESWREAAAEIAGTTPNPIIGGVGLFVMTLVWSNAETAQRLADGFAQAIGMALVLALGGLAFRVIGPRSVTNRVVGVLMIYVASLLMCTLVAAGTASYQSIDLQQTPPLVTHSLLLSTQLNLATAAFVVALLITGTVQHRMRLSEQLLEADAQLAAQLESMRRESNAVNQKIAQLLHGTVQSRLALAAIRLADMQDRNSSPEIRKARGAEVVALLESIEAEIEASGDLDFVAPHQPLSERLSSIGADWLGILDFEWQISADAKTELAVRPQLTDQVADIAREAASNARRHGRASRVTVAVTLKRQEPVTLEIRVTDNGRGPTPDASPGLGQTTLGSIGARWVLLRKEEDCTVLLVVLSSFEIPVHNLVQSTIVGSSDTATADSNNAIDSFERAPVANP